MADARFAIIRKDGKVVGFELMGEGERVHADRRKDIEKLEAKGEGHDTDRACER